MRRTLILSFVLLFAISARPSAAQAPVPANAPYKNARLPVDKRVADLLKR